MPLVPIEYPPGIYRNGTEYQSSGRYHDGQLVRWDDGIVKPMGGWQDIAGPAAIRGPARNVFAWTDENFSTLIMVLTGMQVKTIDDGVLSEGRTAVGAVLDENGIWTGGTLGQNAIACMDLDGVIMQWSPGESRMAPLENAPTATACAITEQGFVFALGADGDPRSVRTSNLRQPTVWDPLLTNQARQFTLQTSGQIMCAEQVQGGLLVLTTEDIHLFQYTGVDPLYHRQQKIPGSRGIVSRNAAVSSGETCYFMGTQNFWAFNGLISAMPCDVEDDVFSNVNKAHAHKVFGFHNADEQEIWWLYPRGDATENSHYVIYNYQQRHWNHGELDRQVAVGPGGGVERPIMVGTDPASPNFSQIFEHETGFDHGGVMPFVEGGPVELGNGDYIADCFRMIPDEQTTGDIEVMVKSRVYPNAEQETFGPYQSENPMSVRFSGRQVSLRFQSTVSADFRIGKYRADIQRSGARL